MLILVVVTVNLANGKGGLFVTTREAASKTQAAAEKETLSAELVGAIKTGGEFDISAVELPEDMKWCDAEDNDYNTANKETPSKGDASWVITKNNNRFYVDAYGNVQENQPQEPITWEEARASKWVAVEEDGEMTAACGVNEKTISLTQTINNVAIFEEVTIGENNGSPITEMKFKEYRNIDITSGNVIVTFFDNEHIEQVDFNGINVNLDSECFAGCSNLTSIIGLKGISEISSYMFEGCEKLANITISSSVTSINSTAFSNCTNLTQITINKAQDSISGAPWGATKATITWQE